MHHKIALKALLSVGVSVVPSNENGRIRPYSSFASSSGTHLEYPIQDVMSMKKQGAVDNVLKRNCEYGIMNYGEKIILKSLSTI